MKFLSLSAIILLPLQLFSQGKENFKLNEGQFFAYPDIYVLASQIDGDQASGYNKFGYQLGVTTGIGLSNDRSVSFQMALSERGSRRTFNPDEPSINAFHIRYTSLDLGILYGKIINQFFVQGGIRGTYLLGVSESEGYVPNIAQDYQTFGALLDTRVNYPLSDHYWVSATFQYSLMSLLNTNVSQVNYLQGGGGAFHNVLGLGIIWRP